MDIPTQKTTYNPAITFSTALYALHSKFPLTVYQTWMQQFFSIVQQQLFLVVYTDEASYATVLEAAAQNPCIRVVLRPCEQFHGRIHKNFWEENHVRNRWLNQRTGWELNMLWNEKVWLVNETIQNPVFPKTAYYGWCDMGYFRNSPNNVPTETLQGVWANAEAVRRFNPQRIHYALVNPAGFEYMLSMKRNGHPVEIPPEQVSIAGGFFFGGKDAVLWWRDVLTHKLEQEYIPFNRLVKDDQIIVLDCILEQGREENNNRIQLHGNPNPYLDPWFVFQTLLKG